MYANEHLERLGRGKSADSSRASYFTDGQAIEVHGLHWPWRLNRSTLVNWKRGLIAGFFYMVRPERLLGAARLVLRELPAS